MADQLGLKPDRQAGEGVTPSVLSPLGRWLCSGISGLAVWGAGPCACPAWLPSTDCAGSCLALRWPCACSWCPGSACGSPEEERLQLRGQPTPASALQPTSPTSASPPSPQPPNAKDRVSSCLPTLVPPPVRGLPSQTLATLEGAGLVESQHTGLPSI